MITIEREKPAEVVVEEKRDQGPEANRESTVPADKRKSLIGIYEDYTALRIFTTGMNSRRSLILEIGAVNVRGGEVADEYDALIHPGHKPDGQTIKMTGIANTMVKNAGSV